MKIKKMKLEDIKVRPRFRKKLGDIDLLAELIEMEGLLSPIKVNEDNVLIDGYRRLQALKKLGVAETEVIIGEAA